jgi:LysR family positive regulator for ilvC
VDAWLQLRSELSGGKSALSGEVRVFGSVTASYSMLTRILPGMRESHPGVELKLRTGDQADGVERVLTGAEDSAIIAKPDRLSPRLAFLPLRQTPLVLVGPTTPSALTWHLDACLAQGVEPDWSEVPMVLAERGLARERLLGQLQLRVQRPNIYAQVAGHEAVVSMVSLGFGVAVVPELVIQHSPKQDTIRILPWLSELAPFELGLCALEDRLADPLLQAFWNCAEVSYPQGS